MHVFKCVGGKWVFDENVPLALPTKNDEGLVAEVGLTTGRSDPGSHELEVKPEVSEPGDTQPLSLCDPQASVSERKGGV